MDGDWQLGLLFFDNGVVCGAWL